MSESKATSLPSGHRNVRSRTVMRATNGWEDVRGIWHKLLIGVPQPVLKNYVSLLPLVPDLLILIGLLGHPTKRRGMAREWLEYVTSIRVDLLQIEPDWLARGAAVLGVPDPLHAEYYSTVDALRLLLPFVQKRLEHIHLTGINLSGSDRLLQTAIAAAASRLQVLILDECDDHRGGFNNVWQTLRAANSRLRVFQFELQSDHGGLALTQLYEGLSHYLLWNTEMIDVRVMARDNSMQFKKRFEPFWKAMAPALLASTKLTTLHLGLPATTLALRTVADNAPHLIDLEVVTYSFGWRNRWKPDDLHHLVQKLTALDRLCLGMHANKVDEENADPDVDTPDDNKNGEWTNIQGGGNSLAPPLLNMTATEFEPTEPMTALYDKQQWATLTVFPQRKWDNLVFRSKNFASLLRRLALGDEKTSPTSIGKLWVDFPAGVVDIPFPSQTHWQALVAYMDKCKVEAVQLSYDDTPFGPSTFIVDWVPGTSLHLTGWDMEDSVEWCTTRIGLAHLSDIHLSLQEYRGYNTKNDFSKLLLETLRQRAGHSHVASVVVDAAFGSDNRPGIRMAKPAELQYAISAEVANAFFSAVETSLVRLDLDAHHADPVQLRFSSLAWMDRKQWPSSLRALNLVVAAPWLTAQPLLALRNLTDLRLWTQVFTEELRPQDLVDRMVDRKVLYQLTEQNPALERLELVMVTSQVVSTPEDAKPWVARLPECKRLVLSCDSSTIDVKEWRATLGQCPKIDTVLWGFGSDRQMEGQSARYHYEPSESYEPWARRDKELFPTLKHTGTFYMEYWSPTSIEAFTEAHEIYRIGRVVTPLPQHTATPTA